ncbi:MAG TPA: ribosome biogenesis GTP-binding protein YihA/YsxC [Candidatus Hydrogenedentes bacterium]|jgi:GTP-binding protein|nr:YihA family ribosome biogenesis GTP-binding protein [Candidatus Hydrogenedentota bacterium]MDY0031642.1 ribosome biogenesis GTP-binding protein YihA/YsxC [FCB group bacterium]NLT59284.1 YihA family ribosome biogenesis GTP-binding protein [Candidatus Hydrogenedentota bacterium]HNZ20116.1 ribosome biogenesis GTP-binding protein YihA/YsxC [Candidatus Hydrogenedentota bacterium]HOH35577.1 ribosome biogenesis GTP-binding protein YihA/YsxC [Candidatus Hydrogenedentota bacterium]
MKVSHAEFITSAVRPDQYPAGHRPEIAFVGRSNVGKSTLLNILLNRRGLAKTSKKPGKTRLINFFDVNGTVHFVDLPGYGFAKVSKKERLAWERSITEYITGRDPLRLVMHLVDARHKPNDADRTLLDMLDEARVPALIVATKADKLRARDRLPALNQIRQELELEDDALVVFYSAETREGVRELWEVIDDCLGRA